MGFRNREFSYFATRLLAWMVLVIAVLSGVNFLLSHREYWINTQFGALQSTSVFASNVMHVFLFVCSAAAVIVVNRFTCSLLRVCWMIWIGVLSFQLIAVHLIYWITMSISVMDILPAICVSASVLVPLLGVAAVYWRYSRVVDYTRLERVDGLPAPDSGESRVLSYAAAPVRARSELAVVLLLLLSSVPVLGLAERGLIVHRWQMRAGGVVRGLARFAPIGSFLELLHFIATGIQVVSVVLVFAALVKPTRRLLIFAIASIVALLLVEATVDFEIIRNYLTANSSSRISLTMLFGTMNTGFIRATTIVAVIVLLLHREVRAAFR
jgi:hypothetical protein